MSTWERIKKKVMLGALVLGMTLTLTGCDLPAELQSSLTTNFNQRADANKSIAMDLYSSGIISEDTYNQLVEAINTNLAKLGEDMTQDNASMQNMLKACVGWRIPPEPDHQEGNPPHWYHGKTVYDAKSEQCPDWADQFISSYLARNLSDLSKKNVPALGGNSGKVAPIEVIPESLVTQLNDELSVPIYALKNDISVANGLDEIIEAIKKADSTDNTVEAERLISLYFSPVKYTDTSGNEHTATIMDPNDPSQQIVRITSSDYSVGSNGEQYDGTIFNGTTVNYNDYSGTANFPTVGNNLPGIDMTVIMSGEKVLAVRLVEFNRKAVDELRNRIGLNEKRYLVLNGKAFLMEYPIGYIKGFKETSDRQGYNSIIERSALGFNLLTGGFSKFNQDSDGNFTSESVSISNIDPYLSYAGATSNTDETKASLVLYGETGVTGGKDKNGNEIDEELNKPFNIEFTWGSENKFTASIGRIVLRDYLELTYAPDVVSHEPLIALGRKLRILNLHGDKSTEIARFYDKDGTVLENSSTLHIDDFSDIKGAIENPQELVYISRQQEEITNNENETEDKTTNAEDETTNTEDETTNDNNNSDSDIIEVIKGGVSKIDKLPTRIDSKVECSTVFPGDIVATSDKSLTDQKPLLYGMFIKQSMFETGLFSGWVQSTDESKNSTLWWNKWLSEHSFNYRINTNELVKYLKGNYAYDLNKEGIVILDLETIAKIQQEYTQQNQVETAHGLRTLFIVVGYILIAYSTILLIAWNVDVNVDLGFNILEKLSFGKWVAVKDYEEMPYMNTDETAFIKFGELVVKCIVIIALGMILIMVNIIDVILMLIQLFGGIAEYITRIITGVK